MVLEMRLAGSHDAGNEGEQPHSSEGSFSRRPLLKIKEREKKKKGAFRKNRNIHVLVQTTVPYF